MPLMRIDGATILLKGKHYSQEAYIDDTDTIDDAVTIDDATTIDDSNEFEALLLALLTIPSTPTATDKLRLDFRGNLVAQVTEDALATKVSIDNTKEITCVSITEEVL